MTSLARVPPRLRSVRTCGVGEFGDVPLPQVLRHPAQLLTPYGSAFDSASHQAAFRGR
jgi:hypothetical protein